MSVQWMYPNVNLNLTISAQLYTKTFVFTNRDAVENKDGTECVNWLLLLDTLNWKTLQKLYIVFIYSFIYFYPINFIIFTKMTGTWATKDWKSCGVLKNEVINVQEQTMPRPLTDSITCADLWGVWALCLPLLRVTVVDITASQQEGPGIEPWTSQDFFAQREQCGLLLVLQFLPIRPNTSFSVILRAVS